jgi:predicted permease
MVWLPLSAWHVLDKADRAALGDVNAARFEAFGRLRPELTAAEATAAVRVVAARYDAESRALAGRPWSATADVVRLRGIELSRHYADELPTGAVIASTIALLILLVCTTTVNSLLVGAAATRRHEIGVRLSLGASRARVVRQLLTEVAILAVLGGALGMWSLGLLTQLTDMARDGFDFSPNPVTTGFVLCYALATATLSGLSPALHATRTGVANVLKDSGGGASRKSRLQRTFVVAQIAVAQPLMVALGLAMQSAADVTPANSNPLRERLVTLAIDTWISAVRREPDPVPGVVRRLAALPGVESVVPIGYAIGPAMIDRPEPDFGVATPDSVPARPVVVMQQFIEAEYFAAVNARLLMGRNFIPTDTLREVSPAVLDRALAGSLFPSGNAIGRRIWQKRQGSDERVALEVVGVVDVARENEPDRFVVEWPSLYLPLKRRGGEAVLLIRTHGPGETIMPAILEAVRTEARLAPVTRLTTAAQADREERTEEIQIAGALAGMGALALLLAAVGLYALVRMSVEQRWREIGIRIALGADPRHVVRMFFSGGLRASLLGLAIGVPLSVGGLSITADFFGTSIDDVTIAGAAVSAAVLAVAALASWLPARRAASVDAMIALRSE